MKEKFKCKMLFLKPDLSSSKFSGVKFCVSSSVVVFLSKELLGKLIGKTFSLFSLIHFGFSLMGKVDMFIIQGEALLML
jgi:hypothetical protein